MKRIVIMIVFLSNVFFAQELNRFIDVNGRAEVMAEADLIEFNINVRVVAEKLADSREQNNIAVEELVKIFNEFAIDKDDYEISPIQFGKEYSYSREKRELIGYYSTVNVSVKLKELDNYYSFIERLSQNNMFEIVRSRYAVSELQKYHRQATIDAVKAAIEKAEYIAESMNLSVGKIIQITELDANHYIPVAMNTVRSDMAGAGEEVAGKVSVARSVNMKVELTDK